LKQIQFGCFDQGWEIPGVRNFPPIPQTPGGVGDANSQKTIINLNINFEFIIY
jgi:hypothetical protein